MLESKTRRLVAENQELAQNFEAMQIANESLTTLIWKAIGFQESQKVRMDQLSHDCLQGSRDIVARLDRIERSIPSLFEGLKLQVVGLRSLSRRAKSEMVALVQQTQRSFQRMSEYRRSYRQSSQELNPSVARVIENVRQELRGHRRKLHEEHTLLIRKLSE
jgi:hypothetical protein